MTGEPSLLDCIVMAVWVAAHHGLRRLGYPQVGTRHLWPLVFEMTSALGNPPAPGGW